MTHFMYLHPKAVTILCLIRTKTVLHFFGPFPSAAPAILLSTTMVAHVSMLLHLLLVGPRPIFQSQLRLLSQVSLDLDMQEINCNPLTLPYRLSGTDHSTSVMNPVATAPTTLSNIREATSILPITLHQSSQVTAQAASPIFVTLQVVPIPRPLLSDLDTPKTEDHIPQILLSILLMGW